MDKDIPVKKSDDKKSVRSRPEEKIGRSHEIYNNNAGTSTEITKRGSAVTTSALSTEKELSSNSKLTVNESGGETDSHEKSAKVNKPVSNKEKKPDITKEIDNRKDPGSHKESNKSEQADRSKESHKKEEVQSGKPAPKPPKHNQVDSQASSLAGNLASYTKAELDEFDLDLTQMFDWLKNSKSKEKKELKKKEKHNRNKWGIFKSHLNELIKEENKASIKLTEVENTKYVMGNANEIGDSSQSQPEADYPGSKLGDKMQQLKEDLLKMREEKEQIKESKRKADEDLLEMSTKIAKLSRTNTDLSERLAKEMSTKLSANESSVENVSIKNRPMHIADKYTMFCTNEWLEAKEALDKVEEQLEHTKIKILDDIFKVVEQEVGDLIDVITQDTNKVLHKLHTPVEFRTSKEKQLVNARKHRSIHVPSSATLPNPKNNLEAESAISAPAELKIAVMDFLRTTSDIVDLEDMVKIVTDKINQEFKTKEEYKNLWDKACSKTPVKKYIKHMVHLVWQMVIQRPKMTFKFSEKWLGEEKQEIHFGSADPKKTGMVYFEVYPMLLHGERMMVKGKVFFLDAKVTTGTGKSKKTTHDAKISSKNYQKNQKKDSNEGKRNKMKGDAKDYKNTGKDARL